MVTENSPSRVLMDTCCCCQGPEEPDSPEEDLEDPLGGGESEDSGSGSRTRPSGLPGEASTTAPTEVMLVRTLTS